MSPVETSQDFLKAREAEKRRALEELDTLAAQGLTLARHVFFIPGWDGEEGQCWTSPYPKLLKGHAPVKSWLTRIVRNPARVTFISYLTFTMKESKACEDFFEFAELLKGKIRQVIEPGEPMDLVGHSMGGLDAIAAITRGDDPLTGVVNCIAVGAPLQGFSYGKILKRLDQLLPLVHWDAHHHVQARNMDCDSAAIKAINTPEIRRRLLERIDAFYDLEGTQDIVVARNARLRTDGCPKELAQKVRHLQIGGATHTASTGLTQDPRTVLSLLKIIAGLPIQLPKGNRGFLVGAPN